METGAAPVAGTEHRRKRRQERGAGAQDLSASKKPVDNVPAVSVSVASESAGQQPGARDGSNAPSQSLAAKAEPEPLTQVVGADVREQRDQSPVKSTASQATTYRVEGRDIEESVTTKTEDLKSAQVPGVKAAQVPGPTPTVAGGKIEEGDDFDDEGEDDLHPEARPTHNRNEVAATTAKFRSNAVHVYGLDFLKTGHMDEIFSQFNHKFIEWINDSSANIVFVDAASAEKALESLSFPKAGDEPWRRTPDILVSEDVPPIFLQMRLAAQGDTKPLRRGVPKALPPVPSFPQPLRQVPRKGRGGRNAIVTGNGGLGDLDGNQAVSQKRKKPITEEELSKRQKRADRFNEAETSGPSEPAAAAAVATTTTTATAAQAPDAASTKRVAKTMEAPERTEDEIERRRARGDRFAAPAPAGGAGDKPAATSTSSSVVPAPSATGEGGTGAVAGAPSVVETL